MWRRRGKRCSRLSRQLALARLEDALGRVDEAQRQAGEDEAQRQAGEPATRSAEGQPAGATSGLAAGRVPAPRASWPGWPFSRAQDNRTRDKAAQRETSDRGAAGQAPDDSRPRRL